MPNEITAVDGGKFQVKIEGQDPITLSAEEVASKLGESWKPLDDRAVTFKVNGMERTATVKELQAMASKAEGADEKFRQAADAVKLQDTLKKIQADPNSVTADDFDLVLRGAGATADQRREALEMLKESKAGGSGTGRQEETPLVIPMENMPPEVKAAVMAAGQLSVAQQETAATKLREQIEKNVQKTLTDDPVLSTIITDEANGQPVAWEKDGTLANTLFQEFMDKVKARVTERPADPITPEVIQGIAQTVRRRFSVLFGKAKPEQSGADANQALLTALGRASSMSPHLQANEPVKRVSSTDPSFSDNFSERFNRTYQKLTQKALGIVR
jgi:NACalpha-BTF3-like transcription factor